MNNYIIIFVIAGFLAIGSILVYTKNYIKTPKEQKASQELSLLKNPNNSQLLNSTPTLTPIPNVTKLQTQDVVVGTGSAAKNGDILEVNYEGTLLDGRKFDSSYDRSETFSFTLGAGQVIAGWDRGLVDMRVGGKRRLLIPSDLAYGAQGNGPIPPDTSLLFEVELVSIKESGSVPF